MLYLNNLNHAQILRALFRIGSLFLPPFSSGWLLQVVRN